MKGFLRVWRPFHSCKRQIKISISFYLVISKLVLDHIWISLLQNYYQHSFLIYEAVESLFHLLSQRWHRHIYRYINISLSLCLSQWCSSVSRLKIGVTTFSSYYPRDNIKEQWFSKILTNPTLFYGDMCETRGLLLLLLLLLLFWYLMMKWNESEEVHTFVHEY